MNKHKLLFLIIPISQVVSSVRYFNSSLQLISSILFIISSFLMSLLLYEVLQKLITKDNKKLEIAYTIIFTALDQGVKICQELTGFNSNIIGDLFQIKQTHNNNQSAILNHFGIMLDIKLVVVLKIILLIIAFVFLLRIKSVNLAIGFVLLLAAQLSSIIDSCFRGYVLDCFYYFKLVCYDLKDYYVDAGIIVIATHIMLKLNNTKKEKSDEVLLRKTTRHN